MNFQYEILVQYRLGTCSKQLSDKNRNSSGLLYLKKFFIVKRWRKVLPMMSVSKREDTVLSEGTPLRRPLLCVFILHFTFFSLLFVTCTCLPQQFTSSFVSFPELFVPQDAAWVAKAPVHFSELHTRSI